MRVRCGVSERPLDLLPRDIFFRFAPDALSERQRVALWVFSRLYDGIRLNGGVRFSLEAIYKPFRLPFL